MNQRQCYHCKQWITRGDPHDCWTTTEAALTRDLAPDLYEAWERLRETAADLGEQRIYASHQSIMFSRRSCYCFVRPKRTFLELCLFLGRRLESPQISRTGESSKTKFFHIIKVTHRDQVEEPITDWLREAYNYGEGAGSRGATTTRSRTSRTSRKTSTRTRAAARRTKA